MQIFACLSRRLSDSLSSKAMTSISALTVRTMAWATAASLVLDLPAIAQRKLVGGWRAICSAANAPRNGRWHMVLDSVDDVKVFYNTDKAGHGATESAKKALSSYFLQSSNGSILVTTRSREVSFRFTGKNAEGTDIDAAKKFVDALEYLPLAISQTAAYIEGRAPRMSIRKYLDEFEKSERERTSLLNYDRGDLRRDESAKNSVIVTWQISFDHIRLCQPSAADLLALMSFFDRQGIFESLILCRNKVVRPSAPETNMHSGESFNVEIEEDQVFEEDIATLRNYCLIQVNEEGDIFEMHGLVQLATRRWLQAYGHSDQFVSQFITRVARAFPPSKFETWNTCQKLFPHAEKAIMCSPIDEETKLYLAQLLSKSSWYAQEQGMYTISESMARVSRDIYQNVLGSKHTYTLDSMQNLAAIYGEQGQWKEAEELLEETVNTGNMVQGPDGTVTLKGIHDLSCLHYMQGKLTDAETLQAQVLKKWRATLGYDHLYTLGVMNNLGNPYSAQGRWKEAKELRVQVLEKRKTVQGLNHPSTLRSMNNLASTYQDLGRLEDAEELGVQVLEKRKIVLGPDHLDALSSRLGAAEELGVQVLDRRRRILGPDHPDTLLSTNNLASTWYCQGRLVEASSLLEDCVQTSIRVLGLKHPNTVEMQPALDKWRTELLSEGHNSAQTSEHSDSINHQSDDSGESPRGSIGPD
ncbi:P-loop containing nucleoside triphosphate hydrolase protein [Xylariaceae sp. FL1272]|nr:P-loop containing nucleoside triphosphate hydrolase protein [Xylariaceae sp. FL1272]